MTLLPLWAVSHSLRLRQIEPSTPREIVEKLKESVCVLVYDYHNTPPNSGVFSHQDMLVSRSFGCNH